MNKVLLIISILASGYSALGFGNDSHDLSALKQARIALPGGFSANDVVKNGNGFMFLGLKKNINGKLYTLVDWDNYGDNGCEIQFSTRAEICKRLTFTKTDPRIKYGVCIPNFGELTTVPYPVKSKSTNLADREKVKPVTIYYVSNSEDRDKIKQSMYSNVVIDLYCE